MKAVKILLVVVISVVFAVSCSKSNKAMTPEDFLKIETEYLDSDQTVEAKEAAAEKYGYTLKAFTDFEEKVEKDVELKKKLGELKLGIQKKETK